MVVKSIFNQNKKQSLSLNLMSQEFLEKYEFVSENITVQPPVWTVRRRTDQKLFTLKKVPYAKLQPAQKKQIVDEVNTLSEISSPYLIKYEEHFVVKAQNTLYVLMEKHCSDLDQMIIKYRNEGKTFSEEKAWKLVKELILALKEIHKNKRGVILHRNIQPKSVYLNSGNIKLGDFRFVKKLDPEQEFSTTFLQDTYYSAPEQLEEGIFTQKSDIWALGCLIYQFCALKAPFEANNQFELAKKIREGKVKSLPSQYSSELMRVIQWCMAKNPKQRPSVEDLLAIPMVNLFIRKNRIQEVERKIKQKEAKNAQTSEEIIELQSKIRSLRQCKVSRSNSTMRFHAQNCSDTASTLSSVKDQSLTNLKLNLRRRVSDKLTDRISSNPRKAPKSVLSIVESNERTWTKNQELLRLQKNHSTYRHLNF